MAIKFEKIQPGMTLWTVERRRMGHARGSEASAVDHYVKSVGEESITVSRNGREVVVPKSRAERMRLTNPKCSECGGVGSHREMCSKRRGVGL